MSALRRRIAMHPESSPPRKDVPYSGEFFDTHAEGSLRSARVVAPLVMELVRPRSVVDFGCGTGTWLRAFLECGAEEVLGLDGDYVDRARLQIPVDRFRPMDLSTPRAPGERFDLAISVEVAEHLPSAAGRELVRCLAAAAPVVLFSAALPGQGGTGHVNERWPWYWRGLFERKGLLHLDAIRPRIWRTPGVEPWYHTNIALYATEERIRQSAALTEELRLSREQPFELLPTRVATQATGAPRRLLSALWNAVLERGGLRR